MKLIVLAQPALSAEPSERALDDPPAREHNETADVRTLDDLQVDRTRGAANAANPIDECAGVPSIGPELSKTKERRCQDAKEKLGTVPILDICRMNNHGQQQPDRVYEDVSLATTDFFAGIVTVRSPFSVVFTV